MLAKGESRFGPENVFAYVRTRLRLVPPPGWLRSFEPLPQQGGTRLCPAAVLIGLVAHPCEVKVILTQRNRALRAHSGQIAFPGGKIEAEDASPAAAAMREASEEIGLRIERIEPLGYLDPHVTTSGFSILPVVAKITPPVVLEMNPAEVDEVFEVPFAYLMDFANHELQQREVNGAVREFYAIAYDAVTIWGVTAAILRNLYERLYG